MVYVIVRSETIVLAGFVVVCWGMVMRVVGLIGGIVGSVYSADDVEGCLCLWSLESERVEMIVWFDRLH